MKRNPYTLFYAVILGAVCSLAPTFFAEFTAPYREANARAEEIRNILKVLAVPVPAGMSSKDLVALFDKTVAQRESGALRFYAASTGAAGQVPSVAVAFSGPGIWGQIKGLMALDTSLVTIRAISFYQNEETPGLGGEIGSSWFAAKFPGKKICDASGNAGFRIRRTGASGPNEIDGISGATLSCGKVELILNSLIREINKGKKNAG